MMGQLWRKEGRDGRVERVSFASVCGRRRGEGWEESEWKETRITLEKEEVGRQRRTCEERWTIQDHKRKRRRRRCEVAGRKKRNCWAVALPRPGGELRG